MVYDDSENALESAIDLGVKSANVASFVAVAQIAAVLINGITLIAIARLLVPSTYGIYAIAYALAALFGAVSLNFGNYLNKYIPHFQARNEKGSIGVLFGDALVFTLVISAAAGLVGVGFSTFISAYEFHAAGYGVMVDLAMLGVIFTALLTLEYSTLIGFGDGKGAAITFVTNNVMLAVSSISLVCLGYGAIGAISGIVIGPLAGAVAGIFIIGRRFGIRIRLKGIKERAKKMFAFCLPIAGGSIVGGLVGSAAIPLLGLFVLPAVVAPFGVALRVGSLISIEMGFVGAVLIQLFANALERTKSLRGLKVLYNYSIYFGVLITAPIVMYLVDFPNALVSTLFPAYGTAVYYIPAMGVGLLLGIIGSYGASLAISAGDVRKNFKYTLITSAAGFAAMLVLVPLIGAYGIIIGVYFLGSIVSDYLYIRYAKDRMRIGTELGGLARILIASAIAAAIVYPVSLLGIRPIFQLAIGVVAILLLYPPLLVKTKALGKREIALMEKMSKRVQTFGKLIGVLVAYASLFC
jgi:O-antigen/teichoic acid export membrane protein